jgi:TPR repeat protein
MDEVFFMKRLLVFLLFACGLSVATPAFSDDVKTGWNAFTSGDYQKAKRIWEPLARQGDANAQYALGSLYYTGDGVLKDYNITAHWFLLASEGGHWHAQKTLSYMYAMGYGVEKDMVRAYMWANISEYLHDDPSGRLPLTASYMDRMSTSEINKAQRLSRACLEKNLKGC